MAIDERTVSDATRPSAGGQSAQTLLATDVSVHFDGLKALNSVGLEVARGSISGLIGPNGAGKTTFVNVLTGFQSATSGTIRIRDRDCTHLKAMYFARMGVARTFQAVRLFRSLTVSENIEAAAIGIGRSRSQAWELADSILDWIGCGEYRDKPAGALPYSIERRVGIARALATEPDFLMLDEPAAGMNEAECSELAETIRAIPDRFGSGVLVIEHNMGLIMEVSQRVTVLDAGRKIAEGTPDEIMADPVVQHAYLGQSE